MRTFFERSPGVIKGTSEADPVLKTVAKIGVEQDITRERAFDYTRALKTESVRVHVAAVAPNPIINYQPGATMQKGVISQEKSAASPVLNVLSNHLNKFKARMAFPAAGPVKVQGRIATHTPIIGTAYKLRAVAQITPPGAKTVRQGEQWKETKELNFLDKFFNWINSMVGA